MQQAQSDSPCQTHVARTLVSAASRLVSTLFARCTILVLTSERQASRRVSDLLRWGGQFRIDAENAWAIVLQDLDFLARRDDFLVGQAVRLLPPAVAGVLVAAMLLGGAAWQAARRGNNECRSRAISARAHSSAAKTSALILPARDESDSSAAAGFGQTHPLLQVRKSRVVVQSLEVGNRVQEN